VGTRPDAVVFDLGGVLIDWDPRRLYRSLFDGDEAAMEEFLGSVCTPSWNAEQDRGRPLAEATEMLQSLHPARADLIQAYYHRWQEMLGGEIPGTVGIVEELERRGVVFIDDSPVNVEASRRLGYLGLHFSTPARLRADLVRLGLLES
jgi:2-haloacid dehalogenase